MAIMSEQKSALDKTFDWLMKTRSGNATVRQAAAELAALRARVAELEGALREIADPKNGHKRDDSVYIPDVVQAAARAALGQNGD